MDEMYNPDQNQKHDEDEMELEIQKRSEQLEQEDAQALKTTRKKLHKGMKQQRETTKELQRQGEQLENVEDEAVSVLENAERGRGVTEEIIREGKLIKPPSFIQKIKNFFSFGRKQESSFEKEAEERKKKRIEKKKAKGDFVEDVDENDEPTTDDDMKLMLKDMKAMRQEADVQNYEIKKQSLDISNINKVNKQSEHIMNKTTQEMKRID